MFRYIILGVDGSPPSLRAAEMAGRLAREHKARLCVVVAFQPVPDYLGKPYWEEMLSKHMAQAQEVMEKALQKVREVEQLETEILQGPAADAILTLSQERQADLIIMGRRGIGGLSSLLLGSQAVKVTAHASCPVLLVP